MQRTRCRARLLAVEKNVDPVTRHERRAGVRGECWDEGGLAGGHRRHHEWRRWTRTRRDGSAPSTSARISPSPGTPLSAEEQRWSPFERDRQRERAPAATVSYRFRGCPPGAGRAPVPARAGQISLRSVTRRAIRPGRLAARLTRRLAILTGARRSGRRSLHVALRLVPARCGRRRRRGLPVLFFSRGHAERPKCARIGLASGLEALRVLKLHNDCWISRTVSVFFIRSERRRS